MLVFCDIFDFRVFAFACLLVSIDQIIYRTVFFKKSIVF